MTLKTMYVMDTDAIIDGKKPELPYQFAAEENMDKGKTKYIVDIVMPIGGSESALFRYPKEGEKVLVGIETDGNNYLMGYLTSKKEKDNIFTGDNDKQILPKKMAGQFFRYKGKTNDTDDKEETSEFGFYTEPTKWKNEGAGKDDLHPEISTVKIISTGDINQKAANHNQIKAKRFELLVNCDGSRLTDKDKEDDLLALGDRYGDDPNLYAGDAHIRAKNRVVIKAEQEIIFEVGRSSISITDKGITIIARKSSSNVATSWDSMLSLTPLGGITMSATRLNSLTGLGFSFADAYGGTMSSKLGIIRIEGVDIRLSTISSLNYGTRMAQMIGEFALNTGALTAGIVSASEANTLNPDKAKAYAYTGLGIGLATKALTLVGPMADTWANTGKNRFDIRDWTQMFIKLLDTIRAFGVITCDIVELSFKAEGKEKYLRENPWVYDSLYMANALFDYTLSIITAGFICWKNKKGITHNSVIYLDGASIYQEAFDFHDFSISKREGNTAKAGIAENMYVERVGEEASREYKLVKVPLWEKWYKSIVAPVLFVIQKALSTADSLTSDKKLQAELMSL